MNHVEAEATGALDRYILGDMTEGEQEGFEAHFFECPECAEEMRVSTLFLTNLKAVLREPYPLPRGENVTPAPAPPRQRQWLRIGAIAAGVLLAVGVGYQNLVQLPQLRQALATADAEDSPPTYYLAETRSEGEALAVPSGSRHVSLMLNQTPGRIYPYYDCELLEENGKSVRTFRVTIPTGAEEWQLRLSTKGLQPQAYTLKVRGAASASSTVLENVAEYHFRLEFR